MATNRIHGCRVCAIKIFIYKCFSMCDLRIRANKLVAEKRFVLHIGGYENNTVRDFAEYHSAA